MSILNILLILLAGTAAGFLNTLAGGGSLIYYNYHPDSGYWIFTCENK